MEKLMIVEDSEEIRSQLRWGLADDYEVLTAATAEEARRILRDQKPSVVTLDVTLSPPGGPAEEGLELLDEIVDRHPFTKVIMVTGNERRRAHAGTVGGRLNAARETFFTRAIT